MYELKSFRGIMCHDNEEWCNIWRGIDLSFQNWNEKFCKFWSEHSEVSKICTLMNSFWPNYILFELKKYGGVRFDGTEDWFKIWRKTDLFLQKWHENFVRPYHEELSSKARGMWQHERLFWSVMKTKCSWG